MKHTKGKWEVSDATSDKTSVVMGKFLVAEAHHGTSHSWAHGIDIKEAQSNATLIAASPTMYNYIKVRADSGDVEAINIISELTLDS